MLKYVLPLILFTSAAQAGDDTGRGYFNEKGEAVWVWKDGKKVAGAEFPEAKKRKPSSFRKDADVIYFQDDGDVRCYYYYPTSSGATGGPSMSCVKK